MKKNIKLLFLVPILIFNFKSYSQLPLDSIFQNVEHLGEQEQVDSLYKIASAYVYDYPENVLELSDHSLNIIGNKNRLTAQKSKFYEIRGWAYLYLGNYEEAIKNAEISVDIALELNSHELLSYVYNLLGVIYYYKGEYNKTEEYWTKELEQNIALGDSSYIATNLSNLGIIAKNNGNYDKAIENYQAALDVQEEIGDTYGMANSISNLGNIYFHFRGNYDKALENYIIALDLYKKLEEKESEADIFNNIGLIQDKLGDYDLAKQYLDSALNIFYEMGKEERIYNTHGNLGVVYAKLHQFELAEEYCNNFVNYNEHIGNQVQYGVGLNQLGNVYYEWGKYYKAYQCYTQSIEVFLQEQITDELIFAHQNLAKTNYELKNFKEAYDNHLRYSILKDSLFSVERQKQLSELETKYETEKKEREIEVLNKDRALQDATLKRQRLVIWFFIVGFAALAFFAIIILRLFRQKKKANIALEEKNHEISLQRDQIFQQKEEITSSIEYASRIQSALLPPDELMQNTLPESFIFFRPRDIVSGDYYWLNKKDHKIISVTADCTGHGVPGAFMSMLGISFLNEIVNIHTTDEIHAHNVLEELRDLIISSLRQTGKEGESRDGMDMTICIIDTKTLQMEFAGAYNPLYLIRNGELIEYKGDKMPIGIHIKDLKPFSNNIIQLEQGDLVYTFSDGYADQFGGPQNQKFRRKTFKELLLEINQLPMEEQKEILGERIDEWQSHYPQVDDILVSGIKITNTLLS